MKKIFLLLAIFTSIIACNKDESNVLTPEEQAKVDDEQIIDYMKYNKFVDFHVGQLPRNIDWMIIETEDDDPEGTQTLYDLMKDNVITTNYNDVDYKMYYYIKDTGKGEAVARTDEVVVDYNLFSLYGYEMSDRMDYTELSAAVFEISELIEGWQLGLEKFNSGLKPEIFPGNSTSPYRELIDTPGRGILLIPSGLAYGSGVLRFDIVIYDNEAVEEE